MSRGVKILVGIVGALLLVGLIGVVLCTLLSAPARSSGLAPAGSPGSAGLPNPATVYCEEQGGRVEIRTEPLRWHSSCCAVPGPWRSSQADEVRTTRVLGGDKTSLLAFGKGADDDQRFFS